MKLYTYYRSSCAYRVRIGLALKGLAYESVPVQLRGGEQRSPEHLARNPQGLVPTLEDGDVVLGQSLAILEYLDERHPEPALLPAAPADRARVRQIALAIACDIHPLQNLGALQRLEHELGAGEGARRRWARGVIEAGLAAMEALVVRAAAAGPFCCGERPSLADVCLVPQLYNARRFGCDLAACPTLLRVAAHCETLEAFRIAAPEAQPDAPPGPAIP